MYRTLLIILLLLSGCVAKYHDISDTTSYSHFINTSYTTKENMYITGLNLPPGYGKDINEYKINPTNNIAVGPEVISRNILKQGTTFTILGIKKCTNCLEKVILAAVSMESYVKEVEVPIVINLDYIEPKYVNKI